MSRKNTAFTKEFKLEALRLAKQPNTCIAHLARDLGIRRNMIYKSREQLQTKQRDAFKRTATDTRTEHHKVTHAELLKHNKTLQKELDLSRMEVDILKKANVDSSEQCDSYTKILICRRAFDETYKAYLYPMKRKI